MLNQFQKQKKNVHGKLQLCCLNWREWFIWNQVTLIINMWVVCILHEDVAMKCKLVGYNSNGHETRSHFQPQLFRKKKKNGDYAYKPIKEWGLPALCSQPQNLLLLVTNWTLTWMEPLRLVAASTLTESKIINWLTQGELFVVKGITNISNVYNSPLTLLIWRNWIRIKYIS